MNPHCRPFLEKMRRKKSRPSVSGNRFNTTVELVEKPEKYCEVALYTSTNPLLTSYMKKGYSLLKSAGGAAMDVLVATVCAVMGSDNGRNEVLYLSINGVRYLLTSLE